MTGRDPSRAIDCLNNVGDQADERGGERWPVKTARSLDRGSRDFAGLKRAHAGPSDLADREWRFAGAAREYRTEDTISGAANELDSTRSGCSLRHLASSSAQSLSKLVAGDRPRPTG
jgi:hypothetical protein